MVTVKGRRPAHASLKAPGHASHSSSKPAKSAKSTAAKSGPAKPAKDTATDPAATFITNTTPGEIGLDALQSDFGWKAGSWEIKLAQEADKATDHNGKTSAAEIEKFVANPSGDDFITSEQIQEMFGDIAKAGGKAPVNSFKGPWKAAIAASADKLGNHDSTLTEAEFRSFVDKIQKDKNPDLPRWLPLQELESMLASLSDATGEKSMMRAVGFKNAVELRREYLQIVFDPAKRIPLASAYVLSAADLALRPKGDFRPATFHRDPDVKASVPPGVYTNSHYDRGHQSDFEGAVIGQADPEGAGWSTMSTTNLAPQTPQLNENSWRFLEQAFHELVEAVNGKAVIVTGSVFLDAHGKPLAPDKIAYIGKREDQKVAIPTHSYKAILLELPNGERQAYGYMVENSFKLPTFEQKDGEAKIIELLHQRRLSVADIEKNLGGVTLFPALSPAESKRLKNDTKASPPQIPSEGKFGYAEALFPESAPPAPVKKPKA